MHSGILVLDFGSQYTQLIARRLREMNIYSELLLFDEDIEVIRAKRPKGIILSGGPSSVTDDDAPKRLVQELAEVAPILGVCYGMQLICQQYGGLVTPAEKREYGLMDIQWSKTIGEVPKKQTVWMSHGDIVETVPDGFETLALSGSNHPAAIQNNRIMALQFHPEVTHTDHGMDLLKYFAFDVCGAEPSWDAQHIADVLIEDIRKKVPDGEDILCALSGGVDSTVVGTLVTKALGADRVHCVFVDTGLLRKNEFEEVLEIYNILGLNVNGVRAGGTFLSRLNGKSDPEEKRKIIGHTFIDVFKEAVKDEGPKVKWLAQGTLYPDVIESVSPRGTSVTIKSHHNVGGLPKDLNLSLIEPLRELFKDEVRELGLQLGIPKEILWRHPFPGPGLAIRVLGDLTPERIKTLQEADRIYTDALKKHGLYNEIWQAFAVLLPVKTVGVQGDQRTYQEVLSLRAVTSKDGMTADWFDFPPRFLREVSNQITNEVRGINRVVYDVTSKPPGTIEWE